MASPVADFLAGWPPVSAPAAEGRNPSGHLDSAQGSNEKSRPPVRTSRSTTTKATAMDVGQDDDAGTDSKDTVKPSAPDVEAGETDLDTSGLDEQAEGLSPPIACEMDVRIDGLESSTQDHMDPGHSNIPSPHLEKRNTIQQTTYGSRAIAERRYACPKCARTFTRPQNLNYHLLVHAQNRPFPCQSCHLSFLCQRDLTRHARLEHGVTPHRCPHCQRDFSRSDALARHLSVKGERPCYGVGKMAKVRDGTGTNGGDSGPTSVTAAPSTSVAEGAKGISHSPGLPFSGDGGPTSVTAAPSTSVAKAAKRILYSPSFGFSLPPSVPVLPSGLHNSPILASSPPATSLVPSPPVQYFLMYQKPGEPPINITRLQLSTSTSSDSISPIASHLPTPPSPTPNPSNIFSASYVAALIDRNAQLEAKIREQELELAHERKMRSRREFLETRIRELEYIEKSLLATMLKSKDPVAAELRKKLEEVQN